MVCLTKILGVCLLGMFGAFALGQAGEKAYQPFDAGMPAGARYLIPAEQLHPTQCALGFREVAFKRDKFNRLSMDDVTQALKKKDVPVVIGPGGVAYMTDGHHTIRALLESNHSDKTVYGTVIANWADVAPDDFWRKMVANNYANLTDAQGRALRDPAGLPRNLRDMQADAYRGLAWAVLEAGGFDERKDVYFQEFRWADYFRSRLTWDDANESDFQRALKQALVLAREPEAAALPGYRVAGSR